MVLTVAALMAAMWAVTAIPAFAADQAPQCGVGAGESAFATSNPPGAVGSGTSFYAQLYKAEGSSNGQAVSPEAKGCSQG